MYFIERLPQIDIDLSRQRTEPLETGIQKLLQIASLLSNKAKPRQHNHWGITLLVYLYLATIFITKKQAAIVSLYTIELGIRVIFIVH